jgi:hypothetical protein
MSTESIKAKYDFGFEEGKYEVIRNVVKYTVIGLTVGALLRIAIGIFGGNSSQSVSKLI